MTKKEEEKLGQMNVTFTVTSICREDLTHPLVGFTVSEASGVTDEMMKEMASKLGKNYSNQILKSSIKIVANAVLNTIKPNAKTQEK